MKKLILVLSIFSILISCEHPSLSKRDGGSLIDKDSVNNKMLKAKCKDITPDDIAEYLDNINDPSFLKEVEVKKNKYISKCKDTIDKNYCIISQYMIKMEKL